MWWKPSIALDDEDLTERRVEFSSSAWMRDRIGVSVFWGLCAWEVYLGGLNGLKTLQGTFIATGGRSRDAPSRNTTRIYQGARCRGIGHMQPCRQLACEGIVSAAVAY